MNQRHLDELMPDVLLSNVTLAKASKYASKSQDTRVIVARDYDPRTFNNPPLMTVRGFGPELGPIRLAGEDQDGFCFLTYNATSPLRTNLPLLNGKYDVRLNRDLALADPLEIIGAAINQHDHNHRHNWKDSVVAQEIKSVFESHPNYLTWGCSWEIGWSQYSGSKLVASPTSTTLDRAQASKALERAAASVNEKIKQEAMRNLFTTYQPTMPLKVKTLKMDAFLKKLLEADCVWSAETTNQHRFIKGKRYPDWSHAILHPCKLTRSTYGGARTDRLANRNRITNNLGMPQCAGMQFYSMDQLGDNGGGTFFADMIHAYGPTGEFLFVVGDELLRLDYPTASISEPVPEMAMIGLGSHVSSSKQSLYASAKKTLEYRLSAFENWNVYGHK